MRVPISFVIALASTFASAAQHELKLTPANVHWGYYDARVKPVLTVKPGDSVRIETLLAGGLERLKMVGVPESEIPEYMRRVESAVTDRGPGAHPLIDESVPSAWSRLQSAYAIPMNTIPGITPAAAVSP